MFVGHMLVVVLTPCLSPGPYVCIMYVCIYVCMYDVFMCLCIQTHTHTHACISFKCGIEVFVGTLAPCLNPGRMYGHIYT
jgi:hypothetical protein